MATDIDKLIQEIRSLSAGDRRRVEVALSEVPSVAGGVVPPTTGLTDEDYQGRLVQAGLVKEVRPRRRDQQAYERFQPVEISGEPLADTIVEERR